MSIKRGATYDDLLKVPDDKVAEIVDGDLYASPRPRIRHAHVSSRLVSKLIEAFDSGLPTAAGWWILFEPELHLGHDILVPDIAGWRRENLPSLPDAPAFTLAPDWVCEILSPTTESLDRHHKLPAYARHGVAFLWLVDASARFVDIFRREDRDWRHVESHRGNARVAAQPFEGALIDFETIWS